VTLFTLPLAGGRELEVSREPAPCWGEWIRLALFRRYGADRMQEGGFLCERGRARAPRPGARVSHPARRLMGARRKWRRRRVPWRRVGRKLLPQFTLNPTPRPAKPLHLFDRPEVPEPGRSTNVSLR
jgi:hypothetical protein